MQKLYTFSFVEMLKPTLKMHRNVNEIMSFTGRLLILCIFLFSSFERISAQTATGTFGAPTGTMPALTYGVTAIGPSNITAIVATSGTNATFSGPAWGHTGGLTYDITSSFSGAYTAAGFNCIYYGIRLPGNSGTGADNREGCQMQCTTPGTYAQAWTASVSSNVVTFTGPNQNLLNGGNVTPKIIVTFKNSAGTAINVMSANGYYFVPFNQALKVNVLVTGNFSGLGPGGSGTTGSDQPILDQFNLGHYNNTGGPGLCTSYVLDFFQMIPNTTVTPTTAVCSGVSNAESITLSTSGAVNAPTSWVFDGGTNGNVTGISGNSTASSPFTATLTNSQTTAQSTQYVVTTNIHTGCKITTTSSAITVNPNPTASTATATTGPICAGNAITLTGSPSGGSGNYTSPGGFLWTIGSPSTAGSPTITNSTSQNASVTASNSASLVNGNLTFQFKVTDNKGCTNTNVNTNTVTVYKITGSAAKADAVTCGGNGTISVSSLAGGLTSNWLYRINDNAAGTGTDVYTGSFTTPNPPAISVAQFATYSVWVRNNGSPSCEFQIGGTLAVGQIPVAPVAPAASPTGVLANVLVGSGLGGFKPTPDISITATGGGTPSNGRIYQTAGSWKPTATTTSGDNLKFDLGSNYNVSGIATQGNPLAVEYVKKYTVEYSLNGATWTTVTGSPFTGNTDNTGVVLNNFSANVLARYIRITPGNVAGTDYQTWKALRVEIIGQPCGSGTVNFEAPPLLNATGYNWYATNVSTPALLTNAYSYSASFSSNSSIYLSAYHNINNCESARTAVNYTVNPKPAKPTVNGYTADFSITFCGSGTLTAVPDPVNANAARFYLTNMSATPTTGLSLTGISSASTYYVTSYNTTTGCESDPIIVTISVTPPFTISNTLSSFNGYGVSCNGGNNGTITTTATTTAYPITYVWSNGKTTTINSGTVTDNITGLAAGSYTVFVTDNANCANNATLTITQPTALTLSLVPTNYSGYGTNCNGSSTGSILATPSGGAGSSYNYSWTSTPSGYTSTATGTNNTITPLPAKTYNLTATDVNGCSITASAVISDPAVISFTTSVGFACSGSTYTSAAVTVNPSGGASGTYQYEMDGSGTWVSTNIFSLLANGSTHTFKVRDASYTTCVTGSQSVLITFPPNGTSVGDCNFIYVTTGGDPSGLLGSKLCPVTLLQAFTIFGGNSARNHILMEAGPYGFSSTITVPAGVVIDGGYNSSTWIKSTNTATTFNINPSLVANANEGHYTGIILNGNNITLQDLTINVFTAGAPSGVYTANRGRSIYGIYSNGTTGFLLSRCIVNTGAASAGNNSAPTASGTGGAGGGGGGGNNGNIHSARQNGCGTPPGSNGDAGTNGTGATTGFGTGGAGGSGCAASGCNWYGCDANGCTAYPGSPGLAGAPGTSTATPANTTGLGTFYTPVDGFDGTNGKGGGGGGRGGEAQSGTCCTCSCSSVWGDGGKGGDGGNGGLGGYKGYGGGSSFAVYAVAGNGTITDCFLNPGSAGSGGTASVGQQPSSRQLGSAGGDNSGSCEGGVGGRGGDGGVGGAGGNGSAGAAGISNGLQKVSGASVTVNGTNAVPNDGTVTADWKRGCTKSQIDLTKNSSNSWTGISADPAFVLNKDSASTSYTVSGANSSPISISYTSTGVKNLSLGTTTLSNFIRIYGSRLVDPISSKMSLITPNMICPTASITLNNTLTPTELGNTIGYTWEISLVSNPFTNVYTSSSASPGTVAAPSGGWQPGGLYQVRLRLNELCCGWSIPIYQTFRIYPVLPQPVITASPTGVICAGNVVRYTTSVAGASSYVWTVTGGTYSNVSSGVIDVTWPTAGSGVVSVVPKDACTPNTDGPAGTLNVTVNANPTVSVTNSVPIICMPGSTVLTASPSSGGSPGNGSFTYVWSPGGSTGAVNTLTVTPTPAGTYTYTVQVTEGVSGCKVTSSNITIEAKAALSASSAAAALSNCQLSGAPFADLTATAPGSGTSGIWAITNGGPGTITTATSNNTQITGLSNTGASTAITWAVSYSTAPACTATSSTFTLTPPNLSSLTSVSVEKTGTASPRPSYYACRTCTIRDGNTYTYYDNVGKIIAKIQDLASPNTELASTEVCVGYDYNPLSLTGIPATDKIYVTGNVKTVTTNLGDQQAYLPRSWTIKPTTTNTDVIVTLYFTDVELAALQAKANGTRYQFSGYQLAVTKYPGGTGAGSFIQPASAGGVNIIPVFSAYNADHQATFAINSFSTFYIHPQFYPFAPLPVELTSFTGWNQGAVNKLQWVTASESNTAKYVIEKSLTNSNNWINIGEKTAAGNSNQQLTYDFTDINPVIGNNYYRLKIIDLDGTFSYSNVINIPITEVVVNNFTRVYPNPTDGELNVEIQSTSAYDTKVLVFDVVGKKIIEKSSNLIKGLNTIQFDFSSLANGTYVLQFSEKDGKIHTTKFVKD